MGGVSWGLSSCSLPITGSTLLWGHMPDCLGYGSGWLGGIPKHADDSHWPCQHRCLCRIREPSYGGITASTRILKTHVRSTGHWIAIPVKLWAKILVWGEDPSRVKVGLSSQFVRTGLWRVLGTSMVKLQGREGYLAWWAWRAEHWAKEGYSWALRSNRTHCTGFWTRFGTVTPFLFPNSPFWREISVLSLPSTIVFWKTGNLFDFPGSLWGQFALRWIISWVLPIWFRWCLIGFFGFTF